MILQVVVALVVRLCNWVHYKNQLVAFRCVFSIVLRFDLDRQEASRAYVRIATMNAQYALSFCLLAESEDKFPFDKQKAEMVLSHLFTVCEFSIPRQVKSSNET